MEVPTSQVGEMAIPLSTAYCHDNPHSNIIIPNSSTNGPLPPPPIPTHLDHHSSVPYNGKKTTPAAVVKYKECLKNHAAAMGGNATDGCGEFMPSGEEGTLEALTCSACSCHRNFHRKQTTPDDPGRPPSLFHYPKGGAYFPPPLSRTMPSHHHHQMIMPYRGDDESDHEVGEDPITIRSHSQSQQQQQKKRFRTKFTQEQKEKMLGFAERVGWKIQKQEEAVVHQFCQEVGVKRRVLKVWMHNNKHNIARRNTTTTTTTTNNNNPININTTTTSCSSGLQHQPTTSITHTHHLQGTG